LAIALQLNLGPIYGAIVIVLDPMGVDPTVVNRVMAQLVELVLNSNTSPSAITLGVLTTRSRVVGAIAVDAGTSSAKDNELHTVKVNNTELVPWRVVRCLWRNVMLIKK
jgi:hypothetical protein